MLFKKTPSETQLVGVWKHRILASWASIEVNSRRIDLPNNYNEEIFNFRPDGSFTFGEYSGSGPLYEVRGYWRLSPDKSRLLFSYLDGETSSIDIRDYTGRSFVTTSLEGNDFKYVKE